ncbi:MAG: VCBS repeat-containing protein [Bacteroidetes bacterium]|nr:VCBS repeat-containing protein [Bacteroidota bacterium]MBU1484610.1 VCBS repeat-containing protein [Bacteroidota bacterium]MBU2376004.1 VCBS repeat-containing protein [Bacteroidota bacterium]
MKKNIYLVVIFLSTLFTACNEQQLPGVSPYSPEKELISFKFLKANNPILDKDYSASINGQDVSIEIPKGTNLKDLIPTFEISDKATLKVNTKIVSNGKDSADFSGSSVALNVIAQNETINKYFLSILLTGVTANLNINSTTSYTSYLNNRLYIVLSLAMAITPQNKAYNSHSYDARAYGDFDKDGDLDMVAAFTNSSTNTSSDVEFYKNNGFNLMKDQTVFTGGAPKLISGAKAITGDFDENGWLDVVISSTGFNGGSYPGESVILLLNTNGKFTSKTLSIPTGYYGSVCAGDIDNDGDLDLFVTDNKSISKFLINDGKANFTYDNSLYPSTFYNKSFFTSELYDINKDGYLDLVLGGFEQDNASTIILWGNGTGSYMTSKMTTLPKVKGKAVVVDIDFIDFDKDGKTDLLITRKSDGNTPEGYYLQLLKNTGTDFTDVSSTSFTINSDEHDTDWIKWIRIQDIDNDGDLDITTDDRFYNKVWINNKAKFSLL